MAEAGLGWREIIASLTTTPDVRYGFAARKGRVAAAWTANWSCSVATRSEIPCYSRRSGDDARRRRLYRGR